VSTMPFGDMLRSTVKHAKGACKGAVFSGDMKHEVVNAREIQGANKMK